MTAISPFNFTLKFIGKEKISIDTYSFYFDRSNYDFNFLPGQYVRITLPHENPDERGISRFFTISSSPLEKDYAAITTKIIQSSFKKKLAALKKKETVNFFGPLGNFVLDEKRKENSIFLGGGIGITPFHSMITYAGAKKLPISLILFASFSTTEEILFYKELSEISTNNSNIKIIYTITRPEKSQKNWEGEKGRISDVLIRKYSGNIQKHLYYIAGPPKMVTAMKEIIVNMKVDNGRIFTENFVGY